MSNLELRDVIHKTLREVLDLSKSGTFTTLSSYVLSQLMNVLEKEGLGINIPHFYGDPQMSKYDYTLSQLILVTL